MLIAHHNWTHTKSRSNHVEQKKKVTGDQVENFGWEATESRLFYRFGICINTRIVDLQIYDDHVKYTDDPLAKENKLTFPSNITLIKPQEFGEWYISYTLEVRKPGKFMGNYTETIFEIRAYTDYKTIKRHWNQDLPFELRTVKFMIKLNPSFGDFEITFAPNQFGTWAELKQNLWDEIFQNCLTDEVYTKAMNHIIHNRTMWTQDQLLWEQLDRVVDLVKEQKAGAI